MTTAIRSFSPAALFAVILLALLTACSDSPATPQAPQPQPAQVDSALNQLLSRIDSGAITEAEAAEQTPLHRDGTVAVTIGLSGDPRETLDLLQSHDISPRHATAHYIEVFVPPLLLREIAETSATQRQSRS